MANDEIPIPTVEEITRLTQNVSCADNRLPLHIHPFKSLESFDRISVRKVDRNIFVFAFDHEADRALAFNQRPWTIRGVHLVLKIWSPDLALSEIDFSSSAFWIQVHGLPPAWYNKDNVQLVGGKAGSVIDVDFSEVPYERWQSFKGSAIQRFGLKFSAYGEWLHIENDKTPPGIYEKPPAEHPISLPCLDGCVDAVQSCGVTPTDTNEVSSFARLLEHSLKDVHCTGTASTSASSLGNVTVDVRVEVEPCPDVHNQIVGPTSHPAPQSPVFTPPESLGLLKHSLEDSEPTFECELTSVSESLEAHIPSLIHQSQVPINPELPLTHIYTQITIYTESYAIPPKSPPIPKSEKSNPNTLTSPKVADKDLKRKIHPESPIIETKKPKSEFGEYHLPSNEHEDTSHVVSSSDKVLSLAEEAGLPLPPSSLVGFYGPPYYHKRIKAWTNLVALLQSLEGPRLCFGDFNLIVEANEKLGGHTGSTSATNYLRNLMFELGAVDLGFSGAKFTWCNKRWGKGCIKERLDRGVTNSMWRTSFPRASAPRPFRFEAMWTKDPRCYGVINEAWKKEFVRNECFHLCKKQFHSTIALRKWNKEVFGHCQSRISEISSQIEQIQCEAPSFENCSKEASLQFELNCWLSRNELIWRQKSRETWLRDGDRNTMFFHISAVVRHRKNSIDALRGEDGIWLVNLSDIREHVVSNFQQLFTEEEACCSLDLENLINSSISMAENAHLCQLPSPDEIRDTVFSMQSLKSPGPDRLPPLFYKKYWHIVGQSVATAIQNFFSSGKLLKELNYSFIVLIPKIQSPSTINHYRPISLCNMTYKIISNLLVDRLKGEILHSFKKRKIKGGFVALKLDLQKAYDRDKRRELKGLLAMKKVNLNAKYLGSPLFNSKSRIRAFTFLQEKLESRLLGWRCKALSWAGRATMIKAVALALPSYTFSASDVPVSVSWADLCTPRASGGLGFRRAKHTNDAMITKLAWMVASGRDNPCMNALKSKYKVQHGWINSEPPKVASSMWRAIERLKPSVSKGACFIIGDGKSVDYWKNPWIPWLTNFLPKPKSSLVSTQPTLVVSLINSNNRSWNLELLEELFDIESVNAIGRINLPLRPIPDKLAWIVDSKGAFSVKSAYNWGIRADLLPVLSDMDVVKLVVNPPVPTSECSSSRLLSSQASVQFALILEAIWNFRSRHVHLQGVCWKPPPLGCVKINVDLALHPSSTMIAAIARNEEGLLIKAWVKPVLTQDPLLAKAYAIHWAIILAKNEN
uniref:DUF4283 domain-containing protein n=1 Tax=Fagus sylvatica TaxID=28930 RepID=A0A2N9ETY0_FAGSY